MPLENCTYETIKIASKLKPPKKDRPQTGSDSGLPLVFSKIFPGFPNFFQVFKSTNFWVYF